MRRERGFTIVEILVSLALAGLLAAGALQMYSAFHRQGLRQQQIAEMQQSLRVADQVLARALRGAGAGLNGGLLSVTTCSAGTVNYFPIQFSNSNAYTDLPKTSFDSTVGGADMDPDWIRVVGSTPGDFTPVTDDNGANLTNVCDTSKFQVGDFFVVVNRNSDPAQRFSCLRLVTQITNAGGRKCGPNSGGLQHNPGQGQCINPPPGQDDCLRNTTFPTVVFRASNQMAVFRIDNTTDPRTPRLMVSYSPPGEAAAWRVVADNIEDLQIALLLDNGTLCDSVDDPVLCDPRRARMVRYILVARSSSPVPGFNLGRARGFEDEPTSATSDGYLRRSVASVIQLRNLEQP
jgi:prepilin-type N-terminal cleavage/methylation domain-containing protein